MQDIKQEILYHIDDLKDLQNLCFTDKQFYNLCSNKSFWMHWYNKNNIKFPNSGFVKAEDWINEYIEFSKFNKIVNAIIFNVQYFHVYYTIITLENLLDDDNFKEFYNKYQNKNVRIRINYNKGFIVSFVYKTDIIYINLNKNQLYNLLFTLLVDGYEFLIVR